MLQNTANLTRKFLRTKFMKKILGLDLGVGSVGWSLIETDDDYSPKKILGMGSRIVPLSPDESSEFTSGNAASKNQKRTQRRTTRKGYDRYQMRRQALTEKLRKLGMLPDEQLIKLPVLELWALRSRAATSGEKLTLPEIGRVLYHINQKRGYRHSKSDDSGDKQQRDYVKEINRRYQEIIDLGETIGQHFAKELKNSEVVNEKGVFYNYRIKDQVFPRDAYKAEFDRIMDCQRKFYPDVLTDENIREIRDEIIFYQRNLKSCKHLVSECEFMQRSFWDAEHKPIVTRKGEIVVSGPKVAPKSSPISQVCKIWEEINNLRITNKEGDEFYISLEHRKELFEFLETHEKVGEKELYKILGIKAGDGWSAEKAVSKGLKGDTTRIQLAKALENLGKERVKEILRLELKVVDSKECDKDTGEVYSEISPDCESEPLYRLWHLIYSVSDKRDLANALKNQFGIEDENTVATLSRIDFVKQGYGSRSVKFMRKILPLLMQGAKYSEACEEIDINHSGSLTVAQNNARHLLNRIPPMQKNELRQPVVEKILGQMINVVNALLDRYGDIDEIRVEMARELKMSREGREETAKNIGKRERANEEYAKRIMEYGFPFASKNRILKYRLWEESGQTCFYCGQPVNVKDFLGGRDVEIEHVVPKSLLFDDSFSNKVCACRACNESKGNSTAYDFMKSRGDNAFNDYLSRVDKAYKEHRISQTKRNRLLTPADKIPKDFISRQLVQTQYISRKAMEILKSVCRNVYGSSGDVTAYLRRIWGYGDILHSLNFNKYKEAGLVSTVEYNHRDQTHQTERINDWSKRMDHRHHAIDALTIASTRQSIIQRLNSLSSSSAAGTENVSLDNWTAGQPHFSVAEVSDKVSQILVSFKSGKKVTTPGKRYVYRGGRRILAQTGLLVPRGALSEESVYGRIKYMEKVPVNKLFDRIEDVVSPRIRAKLYERLNACEGSARKAAASLNKEPLYVDESKTVQLEWANCYNRDYVIKYSLGSMKAKDAEYIVDEHIRNIVKARFAEFKDEEKKAFAEPLYADAEHKVQIKSVRCYTGLGQVVPVKKNAEGEDIGFVKPGNNHHVAIYRDAEGAYHENIVTFWDAVERKKYGIPEIVRNPDAVWQDILDKDVPESLAEGLPDASWTFVLSMQQNEMFVLGMEDDEFNDALSAHDYKTLGEHLYRVQKLASVYYVFRSQYETKIDDTKAALQMKKFYRTASFKALFALHPRKVRISQIGELSLKND